MLDVPAMERVVMTAIGFFVLLLVLVRGVNELLLWMDRRDWILIPNREAIRNADERMARMFTELQSYAEPAKRQIVKKKEFDELRREQDDQGDGRQPNRIADRPDAS